jgi:hypothetical protein
MDTTRRRPGDGPALPLGWQLTAPLDGRWGVQAVQYTASPQCRYCGVFGRPGHPDCFKGTCLACGTVQCAPPRGGDCLVCMIGFISQPPWNNATCGYTKCDGRAVARAPRVRTVCLADLSKAKSRGQTLADQIADYVRLRERGGHSWQKLVWFGPARHYAVRRWHDDGRAGWTTGSDPKGYETAGQADREAQAWNDPRSSDGWHAERVLLTDEVRDEIDAWQGLAPGKTKAARLR